MSESQSSNCSNDAVTSNSGCNTGCSNSPENERSEAVERSVANSAGESISSGADTLPIKADSFSAALAMIASLPLTDGEKADAVRRILAEQGTAQERDGEGR